MSNLAQPRLITESKENPPTTIAKIVGLYGLPGSGKSYLKARLEQELKCEPFNFYEGAEVIADLCPGGLDGFKQLDEVDQAEYRKRAIKKIGVECVAAGVTGIVLGHFMFWTDETATEGNKVWTDADQDIYSYIIYLDVAPATIYARTIADAKDKKRPDRKLVSDAHIAKWQEAEKQQLRSLCYTNDILLSVVHDGKQSDLESIMKLLRAYTAQGEDDNLFSAKANAKDVLGSSINTNYDKIQTVLVIDADKTLTEADTGKLFWESITPEIRARYGNDPLKTLFSSPMGYSYIAFRQAMLIYSECGDEEAFDGLCAKVASQVQMYLEFAALLKWVAKQSHIGAVIVTSGLKLIWTKVMQQEGLAHEVHVVGGGRLEDRLVITPKVKGELVRMLQADKKYVWAFGDSPVDKDMLCKADEAIVVVGLKHDRSASMDTTLDELVVDHGFRARQTLPTEVQASLRLSELKLPVVRIEELIEGEIKKSRLGRVNLIDFTDKPASKLLARNMRDSNYQGVPLREAHRQAGRYLATEAVANLIGLEQMEIGHVKYGTAISYRLLHEQRTSIVAAMRGGEPMASGVHEAFPLARFYHAKNAKDVKKDWLEGQSTVLLVDSVINEGGTIAEFFQHIRDLHTSIRVIVITGVMQHQALDDGHAICNSLDGRGILHIIALRVSKTKFVGSGGTDTGNRLFNTTHQP